MEVFHKFERLAAHPRERKKYGYTTVKEYMPSHQRFISEWSSEKFIAWAGNIRENCKGCITGILDKKQHPGQSHKSCLGILHLAKREGNLCLDNACKKASVYGTYNYNIIDRIRTDGAPLTRTWNRKSICRTTITSGAAIIQIEQEQ